MSDHSPIYCTALFILRAALVAAFFFAPSVIAQIAGGVPA